MSWKKVKLGELCRIEKGATGILKAIEGEYPLVVTSKERKSHNEYQFDEEAVIIPLVSSTGHGHKSLKRIHFQTGKFALGSILCAVIPKDKSILSAEYLYRFLDLNKENELVSRMKGMANVTLPMKAIAEIEIPLMTLKQQKGFIEKYKNLEIQSTYLNTELHYQLDLVKKLRQQFLQEAIQGKLVPNEPSDSAKTLLQKIKSEKAKSGNKEKPLLPIPMEEIPFEIPANWVWCRLGEIATAKRGKSPNYSETGVFKMLNQKCIRWYYIDIQYAKAIDETWFDNIQDDFIVKKDDLLINSTGDGTIGRSAVADDSTIGFIFDSHILNVKSFINQKYVCYFINSEFGQKLVESVKSATTTKQTELGVNNLSNFPIPLPPLAEQTRIVAQLEKLMQLCDGLEWSIQRSKTQNESLLQQVLRESLSGSGALS